MIKLHIDRNLPIPLYCQLSEQIRQAIVEQQLPPGTKIPTERKLMETYGLSYPTVTKALRELVNEGVIKRIQGKGSFVMDKETTVVRHSQILGLVLCRDLSNGLIGPFYSRVFNGIYDTAIKAGYGIQVFTIDHQGTDMLTLQEQLRMGNVQGLFYIPPMPNDIIVTLAQSYPTVIIDHHIDGETIDAVVTNNYAGSRMAMRHLIGLGHRRIGYIAHYVPNDMSAHERYLGYHDMLVEMGIGCDPDLIVTGKNGFDRGHSAMKALLSLENPPTAVFAHNDETALSAMEAINQAGLSIPQDISIMGFDDVDLAEQASVPLSTVRIPKKRMGALATKKLIAQIEGHPQAGKEVLSVELVVRKSTGAVTVSPTPAPAACGS